MLCSLALLLFKVPYLRLRAELEEQLTHLELEHVGRQVIAELSCLLLGFKSADGCVPLDLAYGRPFT